MSSSGIHQPTISALKNHPDNEKAKKLLERLWKQCEPLVRRHSLKVTKLSEFLPNDNRLLGLNINKGYHIKIRLRHYTQVPVPINLHSVKRANNNTSSTGRKNVHRNKRISYSNNTKRVTEFMDFESILGTMLHELAHNIQANHSPAFYQQLNVFEREMEDLISKNGWVVMEDGWLGTGNRLGGTRSTSSNVVINRQTILQATEKRLNKRLIFGKGEYRLGGDSCNNGGTADARQLAVEAALKRRQAHDAEACSIIDLCASDIDSDSDDSYQPVKTELNENGKEVIIIVDDDEDD